MSTYTYYVIVMLVPILTSCQPNRDQGDAMDSWITKIPSSWKYDEEADVRYRVVLPESAFDAIARLEKSAIVLIPPDVAHKMTGEKGPDDLKAYIMRAVVSPAKNHTGALSVKCSESQIWVRSGALGPDNKGERRPIVVWLTTEPKDVFVTYSAAM